MLKQERTFQFMLSSLCFLWLCARACVCLGRCGRSEESVLVSVQAFHLPVICEDVKLGLQVQQAPLPAEPCGQLHLLNLPPRHCWGLLSLQCCPLLSHRGDDSWENQFPSEWVSRLSSTLLQVGKNLTSLQLQFEVLYTCES